MREDELPTFQVIDEGRDRLAMDVGEELFLDRYRPRPGSGLEASPGPEPGSGGGGRSNVDGGLSAILATGRPCTPSLDSKKGRPVARTALCCVSLAPPCALLRRVILRPSLDFPLLGNAALPILGFVLAADTSCVRRCWN
jgi:hypothetical protein